MRNSKVKFSVQFKLQIGRVVPIHYIVSPLIQVHLQVVDTYIQIEKHEPQS